MQRGRRLVRLEPEMTDRDAALARRASLPPWWRRTLSFRRDLAAARAARRGVGRRRDRWQGRWPLHSAVPVRGGALGAAGDRPGGPGRAASASRGARARPADPETEPRRGSAPRPAAPHAGRRWRTRDWPLAEPDDAADLCARCRDGPARERLGPDLLVPGELGGVAGSAGWRS